MRSPLHKQGGGWVSPALSGFNRLTHQGTFLCPGTACAHRNGPDPAARLDHAWNLVVILVRNFTGRVNKTATLLQHTDVDAHCGSSLVGLRVTCEHDAQAVVQIFADQKNISLGFPSLLARQPRGARTKHGIDPVVAVGLIDRSEE